VIGKKYWAMKNTIYIYFLSRGQNPTTGVCLTKKGKACRDRDGRLGRKLCLEVSGVSEVTVAVALKTAQRSLDCQHYAGFPPRRPVFKPGSGQVGFVVDKVALGQVFSEYFCFPFQSSFFIPQNSPSS
jgi:hypothetical protein